MIRVVIADDQALIRAGFRVLVDSDPEMEVVGEAQDGAEAIRVTKSARADIVLMDIRMPRVDGLTATRAIVADEDLAGVKVIILTTFELDEYVAESIRAGASGFLGKGVEASDLLDAIRVVAAGEALLSPNATRSLIAQFLAQPDAGPSVPVPGLELLTPREREVVSLVGKGLSNEEITAEMYVSAVTAKTHANRAMMKLGAHDRAQLVIAAFRSGLAQP